MPTFEGFDSPTYTQVPDQLFDELLPDLSGAELKVLLYITRRTMGFKRDADTISISQLMTGITTRDGRVLDRGTGLSRDSVTRAVKTLCEQGIIEAVRNRSHEYGDQPTTYTLHMKHRKIGHPGSDYRTPPQSENQTPPSPINGLPRVRKSDPQETVLQETEEQETGDSSKASQVNPELAAELSLAQDDGPVSETPELDSAIESVSDELEDRQHDRSNRTRARNLMAQYGVDEFTMVKIIRAALTETQRHSGQLKNPAAYFFGVVEDRLKTVPGAKKSLAGRYWRQVRH